MRERREIRETVEQCVLGCVLLDPESIGEIAATLSADNFSDSINGAIWNALLLAYSNGSDIEPVAIAAASGAALDYLIDLAGMMGSAASIKHYAAMVVESHRRRQVAGLGAQLVSGSADTETSTVDLLDQAQQLIAALAADQVSNGLVPANQDVVAAAKNTEDAFQRGGAPKGPVSGLPAYDKRMMGFEPEGFHIIAARPSVGKTAFAMNIAAHCAKQGKRVAVFSLEMSRVQLVQRILAAESSLNLSKIIHGKITAEQWPVYMGHCQIMNGWACDLLIDDSGSVTPVAMRAALKRAMVRGPIDLVVIDYLQLMTSGAKSQNRQEEVSAISRALKSMARDLKVPLVALSQLSRAVESRSSPVPTLADLRESGSLEQDADTVTFIYRDGKADDDDRRGMVVAKNRNGPVGTIGGIRFIAECTKFVEEDCSGRQER